MNELHKYSLIRGKPSKEGIIPLVKIKIYIGNVALTCFLVKPKTYIRIVLVPMSNWRTEPIFSRL